MSRVDLGRPVIKPPVWSWEIPLYLYAGGMAGASAGLAFLAELAGNPELSRRAWTAAMTGVGLSPVLLVSDLGRPARFLNMLRLAKVTSPMSVGSWVLAASGAATSVSALHALTGRLPGPARAARPAAALLGLPLATYTGALLSTTSVPVWHEGRRMLPVSFAGSAAASAGAAAAMITPPLHAAPARRLALLGLAAEIAAAELMRRRRGDPAEPYRSGPAAALGRAATAAGAAGAAVLAVRGRRSRTAAVTGGALVTAGSMLFRWSVFRAGFQSAVDPWATVRPQRERIEAARA